MLLATEDPAVLADARAANAVAARAAARHGGAASANVTRLFWTARRRTNDAFYSTAAAAGGGLRGEAHHALANLYLALEADAVVATLSSNWARVLLRLMAAQRTALLPDSAENTAPDTQREGAPGGGAEPWAALPPYVGLDAWSCDMMLNDPAAPGALSTAPGAKLWRCPDSAGAMWRGQTPPQEHFPPMFYAPR